MKKHFILGIYIGSDRFDFKLFAVTGDIPALNLILNFVGHTGYFACHHCLLRGVHRNNKRQFPYDASIAARTPTEFAIDSQIALTSGNERRHLGQSILLNTLDCELPYAILIDYAHTTLLRHGKLILSEIHSRLRPADRAELDEQLASQSFPHFFHRRLHRLSDLSFVKATEVRNLLFYALLPCFDSRLPLDLLAYVALFITAIRLWHGQPLFGNNTPHVAHDLFIRYYAQFDKFFPGQLNITLHNHLHFKEQYRRFGSLCHSGSFGQESLIGYVGSNWQGTRYLGESICHYYSIDFALHNHPGDSGPQIDCDGPIDNERSFDFSHHRSAVLAHDQSCVCQLINSCLSGFQRWRVNRKCFHSLSYSRRQKSVSYFVRCQRQNSTEFLFGKIVIFFTHGPSNFALLQVHPAQNHYSDSFQASDSYFLLKKPLDRLFFRLSLNPLPELEACPLDTLLDHCIVFTRETHLIATPVSSYDEHN